MQDRLIGQCGWIFQTGEDLFDRLNHDTQPIDIARWQVMSAHRTEACKCIGGSEYLTLVCPEKASSYARMLPDGITISGSRPAVAIAAVLPDRMLYPIDLLAWEAADHLTYGSSESHWNDYGAYVVYKETMRVLSRLSGRSLAVYESAEFMMKEGEGYCDIGPSHERVSWVPQNTKGRCVFDNLIWSRGNVKICVNPDGSLPTLVIFRDSFSNMLLPFLMESFKRIVAISAFNPILEVVKHEHPDFVICETAERYLLSNDFTSFHGFSDLCRMALTDLDKVHNL